MAKEQGLAVSEQSTEKNETSAQKNLPPKKPTFPPLTATLFLDAKRCQKLLTITEGKVSFGTEVKVI